MDHEYYHGWANNLIIKSLDKLTMIVILIGPMHTLV